MSTNLVVIVTCLLENIKKLTEYSGMGLKQIFSSLFNGTNRQADILVLGLDNSGKSTILNQLKPPDSQSANITPTVGCSVERFTAANINFSAYDMSGESRCCM
jgi:ADP-ribosylation factor-like protein 6